MANCRTRWIAPSISAWVALLCLLVNLPLGNAADPEDTIEARTFEQWRDAIRALPSNRRLQGPVGASLGRLPPRSQLPLKTFAEVDACLDRYFALCQTGHLANPALWLGGPPDRGIFFDLNRAYHSDPTMPFQPFAQKLAIPPGSEVVFHGDLHGDIQSLVEMLQWLNSNSYMTGFKITKPGAHLVFLGDYTDRGIYGTEVLYTLLRLLIANPGRMWLARGNHEDITLIARYGFQVEGEAKYGKAFNTRKISRVFDFLPPVIYVGCGTNYIQCNHGGMEPGFRPGRLLDAEGSVRFQFLGSLDQRSFLTLNSSWFATADESTRVTASRYYQNFLPQSPTVPTLIGFMWNDFTLVTEQEQLNLDTGRGFVYGHALTRRILEQAGTSRTRVRGVFRAHQHSITPNPMMHRLIVGKGVFRHWQTNDHAGLLEATGEKLTVERHSPREIPEFSVWTFNVACDSLYGAIAGYSFDTFGILKVDEAFKDWRLTIVNQEIRP